MSSSGTVLLVDVERPVAAELWRALSSAGVEIVEQSDWGKALELAERRRVHLVVANLSHLADGGSLLCRQLARVSPATLLLCIVRAGPEPALKALQQGATVCLTSPVEPRHLAAQALILMRLAVLASDSKAHSEAAVEVGGLTIDYATCEVLWHDDVIPLTPTEFRILSALAHNPGHVTPPAQVMRDCVGLSLSDREAMELLKVHVYRLRQKLTSAGAPPGLLRNARGFGYMLERRTTEAVAGPRLARTA